MRKDTPKKTLLYKKIIMEQKCRTCLLVLPYNRFAKNKTYKLGIVKDCKICLNNKTKDYRKEYKQKNKEYIKIKNKDYNSRTDVKERTKIWRLNNKDKIMASTIKNKENKSKSDAIYRKNNLESIREKNRNYQKENRKVLSEKRRISRNTNPLIRLKDRLRNRIRFVVTNKRYTKHSPTIEMIGLPYDKLKIYIERQFTKGMSWEKLMKGYIHLDHIIPLSSAKTEEELISLCHYTNIQPLWAKDNLIKNNKILSVQSKLAI